MEREVNERDEERRSMRERERRRSGRERDEVSREKFYN